jgi:hypothetical protein
MSMIMSAIGFIIPFFALYLAIRLVTAVEDIAATYKKSVMLKGKL